LIVATTGTRATTADPTATVTTSRRMMVMVMAKGMVKVRVTVKGKALMMTTVKLYEGSFESVFRPHYDW
jgi:hypothetical protein